MNMKLLICALLLALPTFAGNACDLFVDELNSIKPEDSGIFSNGKINYSRAYTEVPFLERMLPGIYIDVGGHVAVNAYIPKESDKIQIYKEPNLARSEIERFTPCIDRHVKANMDYFLKTCLYEKKLSNKDVYNQLASFVREKYENIKNYCDCKDKVYVTIIFVKDDGSVQVKEFDSPTCLDDSFDVDPVVREWRVIDSLVKELVEPFDDKCDWRNLVLDPQKFSAEKYKKKNWSHVLTEKDCPAL